MALPLPNTNVAYAEWFAAAIATYMAYQAYFKIALRDGGMYWTIGFASIAVAAWFGGLRYSLPPQLVREHALARKIASTVGPMALALGTLYRLVDLPNLVGGAQRASYVALVGMAISIGFAYDAWSRSSESRYKQIQVPCVVILLVTSIVALTYHVENAIFFVAATVIFVTRDRIQDEVTRRVLLAATINAFGYALNILKP